MDWLNVLLGSNGGLRQTQLRQTWTRERLSDYITLIKYQPEEKYFYLTDGFVGYAFELTPVTFSGRDTLRSLEIILNLAYPERAVLQFAVFADPNVSKVLGDFEKNKSRNDKMAKMNSMQYAKHLEDGITGLDQMFGIPVRNFRSFLFVKTPEPLKQDTISQMTEAMKSASFNPYMMNDTDVVSLMRQWLNNVYTGFSGVNDPSVPLRKQIIDADSCWERVENSFMSSHMGVRVITPKTLFSGAKKTDTLEANRLIGGFSGMQDDLSQLKSPFIYCVTVVYNNFTLGIKAKTELTLSQRAAGSWAKEVARRVDEFMWTTDRIDNKERMVAYIPQIVVFERNEEALRDASFRAVQTWESRDIKTQFESLILPGMTMLAMPFGFINVDNNLEVIERHFIGPPSTVSLMLPIQGDFRGAGKPVCLYIGRKGQVQTFDLFDSNANNHNFLVSAESGSGKSFSLGYLLGANYAAGNIVRGIDIGYSYEKLCRTCSGRFLDFGKEKMVINPFSSTAKDEEDLALDMLSACDVIGQMAYSSSGSPCDEVEANLISYAVHDVFKSGNNDAGVDAVEQYLRNFPPSGFDRDFDNLDFAKERARKLAFNLKNFISTGEYGRFFNGRATFDISNDEFVILELERLLNFKALFSVVTMQLTTAVTQDLYLSDRSRSRFMIFEEAASFLKHKGMGVAHDMSRLANVIEAASRRARKYGGSLGVVFQSMLDLPSFGSVGTVLYENAAFKLYLESKSYENAAAAGVIRQRGLALDLMASVKNVKPRYSEIYFETPFGQGVGRLCIDKWNYWVYTSSATDKARFDQLLSQGRTPVEAISILSGTPIHDAA